MTILIHPIGRRWLQRTLIFLVLGLLAFLLAVDPGNAHAKQLPCHTTVQTISKLSGGISCAAAIYVTDASMQQGVRFPECPGDDRQHWHGWTLTAAPIPGEPGHPVIATQFAKGAKSFVVHGGGIC